jgi:hypothetical protein
MFDDDEDVMFDLYNEDDDEDEQPLVDEFGNLIDPDDTVTENSDSGDDEEDDEDTLPPIDADNVSAEDLAV